MNSHYISNRSLALYFTRKMWICALPFFLQAFCVEILQAQIPTIKQWDYRYGGNGNENLTCFIKTADGGYLLAGNTNSEATGDLTEPRRDTTGGYPGDWWVVKLDSLGQKEWQKRLGGGWGKTLCCHRDK